MSVAEGSPGRGSGKTRFFYGWVVVAVAFVTMGAAISARTGFSILFPELIAEFGWSRGVTAGAFSIGFVASTAFVPLVGMMMDRWGPRIVLPFGGLLISAGYLSAAFITGPIGLYLTFGILVVCGSMATSYIVHAMFLTNWFNRKRGLAVGLAFAGVGVGGIILFPMMQGLIDLYGWRQSCMVMAALMVVLIVPLNAVFQRRAPEEMGLLPDGNSVEPLGEGGGRKQDDGIVDTAWVATDWTLRRAMATARFWWLFAALFCALFAWYAIQVHQTKYLIEIGFSEQFAAGILGLVGVFGIAGQILVGGISDRIGREISWTLALAGYVLCYGALIRLQSDPSVLLVYVMAASQGLLGNGLAALFGPTMRDMFAGRRFATIVGVFGLGGNLGGGAGPFVLGYGYDRTGSYETGFLICIALALVSILCMWMAAPRKVRLVAGRRPKTRREKRESARGK